jgi:hypothetical protein
VNCGALKGDVCFDALPQALGLLQEAPEGSPSVRRNQRIHHRFARVAIGLGGAKRPISLDRRARRPRQRAIGLAFMRTIASQRGSGERSSARGAGSSVLTYRIKHRKPCAGLTPQFSRSSHAQLTLRPTPASSNAGRARSCPAHMWHFSPWRMPERSTPHGSRSSSAAFLRFTR